MKSIQHIQTVLRDLDDDVQNIVMNPKLSLNEKDDAMLPLLQQKRILQQTLKDLTWLQEHPPTPKGGCGMSRYRDDANPSE